MENSWVLGDVKGFEFLTAGQPLLRDERCERWDIGGVSGIVVDGTLVHGAALDAGHGA